MKPSTVDRAKTGGGHADAAVALSVVPLIVGLVVLALRLGLPQVYETPVAIVLGVTISLGYALAGLTEDDPVPCARGTHAEACAQCSAGVTAVTSLRGVAR